MTCSHAPPPRGPRASPEHVDVARLLLAHGAVVTASVLRDLDVEGVGSPVEAELRRVLLTAYQGAS